MRRLGWLAVLAVGVLVAGCAPGAGGARESSPAASADAPATALIEAASAGDVPAVQSALRDGADVDSVGPQDRTALLLATRGGHTEAAKVLLAAGADPNRADAIQDSAYLYAGAEGLTDILRLTLEHGADVTATNRYGGTALIPASEHGYVDNVRALITAGVDVDHVNALGWTALHEAIVLGTGSPDHVEVVRLLLGAGADPNLADRAGTSPLALAAGRGFTAIADLIRAAGGR